MSTLTDTLTRRADLPGLLTADGSPWHYLDTAATAQKPQAVIDATVRAMGADYATVHRGVYARSAEMTLAFEAARRKVAQFIGGQEQEIVFTRGATEAINLVAHSWGGTHLKAGDRILLSVLEHHANIIPWQLLRDRTGIAIDVCPLTDDGLIDLDAAERMLTPAHKLVAFAHVSNVLGSVVDARRAVALAHGVGAKILLDGCQAVPRLPVDVTALGCDFYVFSSHKLYGPTGIGALYARREILAAMPPWQGGGDMIRTVSFERSTWADAPQRFEAGTPNIAGAVGLGAAIDYLMAIGIDRVAEHEHRLLAHATEQAQRIPGLRLIGTAPEKAGILSFVVDGIHPHDLGTILDADGVAIRAGHHCAMPVMTRFGIPGTARASFALYNDEEDVAALVAALAKAQQMFGGARR